MNNNIIDRLNKKINTNNYKSELNLERTIRAINFIDDLINKKLNDEFNIIKTHAPLIYDDDLGINEEKGNSTFTRNILFQKKRKNGVIPNGVRKWSRIISKNIKLKNNEVLFIRHSDLSSDLYFNNNSPIFIDKINLLKYIKQDNVIPSINNFIKKIVKIFKEIISETEVFFTLSKTNIALNNKYIKIDSINFYSEETFLDSVSHLFNENGEILVLNTIPEKNIIKNSIFLYDVYDWKYYYGLFMQNKRNLNVYKMVEVTYDCDFKTMIKQNEVRKGYEINLKNYYINLLKQKMINRSIQVSINMTYLYAIVLDKIHISEVIQTINSDKELELLKKNNIEVF